ncbi:hypothetical protein AMECASPLE_035139 [Ameca splendens]|uniref:Uncharacterized protein n=1 Tax=Ameca splendens TaxID=208324 RepID=A0ABV0ZGY9_9TELE
MSPWALSYSELAHRERQRDMVLVAPTSAFSLGQKEISYCFSLPVSAYHHYDRTFPAVPADSSPHLCAVARLTFCQQFEWPIGDNTHYTHYRCCIPVTECLSICLQ